jgi:hypothetical protein
MLDEPEFRHTPPGDPYLFLRTPIILDSFRKIGWSRAGWLHRVREAHVGREVRGILRVVEGNQELTEDL